MAVTDSEPNFRARAVALGLDEPTINSLCTNGINTIAKFAFSSSYVPGAADEGPFTDAMATALGGAPNIGTLATLRRLLHESFAMTSAELKASVERVEDAPPKRLAQPERADRLQRQKLKLTGLRIEGKLEPSDRLIDIAVGMYEDNRLSYLDPQKCTSKEQEVVNSTGKDDKHIAIDSSGSVRVRDKLGKLDADISSDMFLRLALMRRGLALDQANILDYLVHDLWVERIFDVRTSDQPDGYSQVSHQQVINADKQLFVKLAEMTRGGIQLQASGRPTDSAFRRAMEHPDVNHLLQPLPKRLVESSPSKRPVPDASKYPARFQKGKSKGKGGAGSRTVRMPEALRDGTPSTKAGNPVCFDHNLDGCHLPVQQNRCRKGLHVCCFRNCGKMDHTYKTCPVRGQAQS